MVAGISILAVRLDTHKKTLEIFHKSRQLQKLQSEIKNLDVQYARTIRPPKVEEEVTKRNMRKTAEDQIIHLSDE